MRSAEPGTARRIAIVEECQSSFFCVAADMQPHPLMQSQGAHLQSGPQQEHNCAAQLQVGVQEQEFTFSVVIL
jgi:hypothetical protein